MVCEGDKAQVMNQYALVHKYGAMKVDGNYNDTKLAIETINLNKIDCTFTEYVKLDNEVIIQFCRALSDVFTVELDNKNYQRAFSLTKIVGIGYKINGRINVVVLISGFDIVINIATHNDTINKVSSRIDILNIFQVQIQIHFKYG